MTRMVQIDQDAAIAFECEAWLHRFQIGDLPKGFPSKSTLMKASNSCSFVCIRG
jgi:hypothetical protein